MIESKNIYASSKTQDYISVYNKIYKEMACKMKNTELNKSISHNFILQMIPHHRTTIEMYENILGYTANVKLQDIAYNIINTQKKSIADMKRILNYCGDIVNTEKDLKTYKEKSVLIVDNMLGKMRNAEVSQNLNCTFIREMIPCHNGAIELCQNAMKYPICSGLRPIMSNIVSSQKKGIRQMKILMKGMGCRL